MDDVLSVEHGPRSSSLGAVLGCHRGTSVACFGPSAWIEDAIEDAVATLDDKNRLLLTAREVVRDGDLGETWSHDELMEAVDYWTRTGGRSYRGVASALAQFQVLVGARRSPKSVPVRTLARIIGPSDFSRMFIAKGLERELLAEEESTSPHGSRFYYRVR
jgi:hypothetical protein